MKLSDTVRDFARSKYVSPALRRKDPAFRIVAGEVHRGLGLNNRVPLVCNALASRAFLQDNNLELIKREGPPSGLSTTVVFTYRFRTERRHPREQVNPASAFPALRGIAKQVFESLGGGESFLREERERFNDSGERPR